MNIALDLQQILLNRLNPLDLNFQSVLNRHYQDEKDRYEQRKTPTNNNKYLYHPHIHLFSPG